MISGPTGVRRSILFDARADYLVYGMGEKTVTALAGALQKGADPRTIRGLCYIAAEKPAGYIELPAFARRGPGQSPADRHVHPFLP